MGREVTAGFVGRGPGRPGGRWRGAAPARMDTGGSGPERVVVGPEGGEGRPGGLGAGAWPEVHTQVGEGDPGVATTLPRPGWVRRSRDRLVTQGDGLKCAWFCLLQGEMVGGGGMNSSPLRRNAFIYV